MTLKLTKKKFLLSLRKEAIIYLSYFTSNAIYLASLVTLGVDTNKILLTNGVEKKNEEKIADMILF